MGIDVWEGYICKNPEEYTYGNKTYYNKDLLIY